MQDELILKTGKLYEFDMLADALTRHGVPFYRREEQFSGVQFAMSAIAMQGPGIFYAIYTPSQCADDARQVLFNLPIEPQLNPDMWHFNPRPWVREVMITFAGIYLIMGISLLIANLVKFARMFYINYFKATNRNPRKARSNAPRAGITGSGEKI